LFFEVIGESENTQERSVGAVAEGQSLSPKDFKKLLVGVVIEGQ
jgi:hypothetical protein